MASTPALPARSLDFLLDYGLGSILSVVLVVVVTQLVFSRLLFHPLASVPGPPLAALSSWYGFYYDVIRGGVYVKRVEDIHTRYKSPIVRVGPNHVHVNDPEVFKKVFAIASPFLKSKFFYTSAGLPEAIGAILDPKKHHVRRAILSPRFSPKALASYTGSLVGQVTLCAEIMARRARLGLAIEMPRYTRALTVDVISEFTFGRSLGMTNDSPEEPALLRDLYTFTKQFHICKHFPMYRWILTRIPASVSRKMMPGYYQLIEKATAIVEQFVAEKNAGTRLVPQSDEGTVLDLLLTPSSKNQEIPDASVLINEGCAFIVGGSDTTGYTMESAMYLLLSHPQALQQLRGELDDARPSIQDFDLQRVLELPFLSAVIKETLRLYTPTPALLPRTVPLDGFTVDGHFLPGGTIIFLSLYLIHHNPALFSEPKTFRPERWLEGEGKEAEQYYVPFSRGTRSCIGMNLAYHEMYSFLAILFSRFDIEMVDTGECDMEWYEDMFAKRRGKVKIRLLRDRWSGEFFC
ncbi:cytochrome P450 [Aspergillus californicus]